MGITWVKWSKIWKSKELEGLDIRDVQTFNEDDKMEMEVCNREYKNLEEHTNF